MADSWQKYLYEKYAAFAMDPLKSERSVRLLDVLVKTSRRGSSPILYNIGSIFKLGSKESQETADRLREGLKRFESNTDDEELFQLDRAQLDIKHRVESRDSVKSSLRIFGDAANLDIDGDKHLECELQRVQIASVDRAALEEIIGKQQWKPDVPKLTNLKYWSERSRFNCFGE
ncbi:unnamed protein product, partial [Sphagnum compactum]